MNTLTGIRILGKIDLNFTIHNEKFHHLLLWLEHGSSVYHEQDLLWEIQRRSYPTAYLVNDPRVMNNYRDDLSFLLSK